jgi:hypothetical protein
MIVAKIDGKEHRIIQEYPTREPLDRILSLVGRTYKDLCKWSIIPIKEMTIYARFKIPINTRCG